MPLLGRQELPRANQLVWRMLVNVCRSWDSEGRGLCVNSILLGKEASCLDDWSCKSSGMVIGHLEPEFYNVGASGTGLTPHMRDSRSLTGLKGTCVHTPSIKSKKTVEFKVAQILHSQVRKPKLREITIVYHDAGGKDSYCLYK